MRIDVLSVLPAMLDSMLTHGLARRAAQAQKATIVVHNLRDYSTNKHKKVDDYPYGGGSGMLLQIEPIHRCLLHLQAQRTYDEVILLSPGGTIWDQPKANALSMKNHLILICGHYAGVDARVKQLITQEISIGNYVLSGGEAAAWVVCDSILRLIPGVLNDGRSALEDTFQDNLLAPPSYTRPAVYANMPVPEVLLSGNAAAITKWREEQAWEKTKNHPSNEQ